MMPFRAGPKLDSSDDPAAWIRVEKRNALISNLRDFSLRAFFEKYMTEGPTIGAKTKTKDRSSSSNHVRKSHSRSLGVALLLAKTIQQAGRV
jgi:hypothetical protein